MVKNIIIINDRAYISGGAGKVALTTAIELKKKGYNPVVFSAIGPVSQDLIDNGVKTVCLNTQHILDDPNRFRAIKRGLWNDVAFDAFKHLLSQYAPSDTIIHFHGWSKALSSSLWTAVADYKFKIVVTLHDYFLACPNCGLYNYKKQQICAKQPLSVACWLSNCDARNYPQKIWRCIRQVVQNRQLRKNPKFNLITIGELNRNLATRYLKDKTCRIFDLQNPIEINTNDSVKISENDKYLFMGRMSPEKGLNLFCDALKELGLKGIAVGECPNIDDYRAKYPNVEFVGWKSGVEKEKEIARCKALIFPSLWYEGAPLTIVEMKSFGVPCIVADKTAASEQIEDGVTGLIFKIGNKDSLKEAILKYENSNILTMQKKILSGFDPEKYSMVTHIKALIDIYNKILE